MAFCKVCSKPFESPQKTKAYCSPRCKNTAKSRRKRQNPEFTERELKAQRDSYRLQSVNKRFGLSVTDGFIGNAAETAAKTIWIQVDEVIDTGDDFSCLVFPTHPLPVSTQLEYDF